MPHDPADFPDLNYLDLKFISRIAHAMNRRIDDYSLTESMRHLRTGRSGNPLPIDEQHLVDTDWLDRHNEGRRLLYTVPESRRKQLNITEWSHDGYAESTTKEKALHRRGVDRTAINLAAKDDVTTVIRYCDLWRLKETTIADQLAKNDLFSSRIDVIALADDRPAYAAGIETASGKPSKPRRCVDKLSTLSTDLETSLIIPRKHLWSIMRQLDDPAYFNFESFPDSSNKNYSRTNWVKTLQSEDVLGTYFENLHTLTSLPHTDHHSVDEDVRQKIIGPI